MATQKEIESLTVDEFMKGLDYAVKKKKNKIIKEIKEHDAEDTDQKKYQSQPLNTVYEKSEEKKQFSFDEEDDEFQVSEDTQRTQAIKELYLDNDEKRNNKEKYKKQKKYNIFLLIAFVLGVLYSLYIIYYCISTSGSGASDAENIGIGIGITLIMPHLICAVLATIFNGLGVFLEKRGFALTGAILYTIACVLMPIYFMFTIIQAILSYIGFAKMKKKVYIPKYDR